jgi:preprotein translocase subunit SecF
MLKPLFRLPQKTHLRFVRYFKLCLGLSIAAIVTTTVLLATIGLNFGIDFKGGATIEFQTPGPGNAAALRSELSALNLGEVQLTTFGGQDKFLARFPEQAGGPDAQKAALEKVQATLGPTVKILGTHTVGGVVSGEQIRGAVIALVLTNLGIFIYVWFRFEWQFAIGAIVSLIHDVMFTTGVFAAFRLDFDLSIVAALLTILGYSINDTVVIYDRIRENLRRYKRMPLGELLDLSVNETMSRTIMTVGTVLVALLALFIFGGPVIRGFSFAMLFGVLIGTYSSVFIAAPFLIIIGVKRDWSGVEKSKVGGRAPAQKKIDETFALAGPGNATEAAALAGMANELDRQIEAGEAPAMSAPQRTKVTVTFGQTPAADAPAKSASSAEPRPRRSHGPKGRNRTRSGGGRSKRRG